MSTETQYAGTVAEIVTAPFDSWTSAWSNPTNLQGDTTGTYTDISGGGPPGARGKGLKCTNFGFGSVSGTINSITAYVESNESTGGGTYQAFRIVKGGATGSDTTFDGSSVPNGKGTFTAAGGVWGDSWVDTDITGATFGVVFDSDVSAGFPWSCYHYRCWITVDYTAAAGFVAFPRPRGLVGGLTSLAGGLQ